jgi:hypothetical protein
VVEIPAVELLEEGTTMHELLKAIGIETLPPGETEASLVKKILTDNFFYNRVIQQLVEEWSVGVAERLPQIQRDALRSKFAPKATKPVVVWAVIPADQTGTGKARITATGGGETIYWTGTVAELRRFRFRGESVPAAIIDVYELHSAPVPDPIWVNQQREHARWEKEDHHTPSEIESLAKEQVQRDAGRQ